MWSGRAPVAEVVTKDGCRSCCCWRPLRLHGSHGWCRVRLQRRMVDGAAACSYLRLAAAAAAAPAAECGGCDCGWGPTAAGGLCGLRLAPRASTAAAGTRAATSTAASMSCRYGCWRRMRLRLLPLRLAVATTAAPAAAGGCGCQCNVPRGCGCEQRWLTVRAGSGGDGEYIE